MRTTVDLPAHILERVKQIAAQRGASVSSTIAELTEHGIAHLEGGRRWWISEQTGAPVVSVGRRVTNEEVLEFLGEE